MTRVTPQSGPPPTPRTEFGQKVMAHQRYYTSDGKQVPGVTTILSVLAKPALVGWANRLGLQGIDTNKYVDETALIGTLTHHMVEAKLAETEPDFSDFSPAQLERAKLGFDNFLAWHKTHELHPDLVEHRLVSNVHRYGGTIDFYGQLDGVPTLVDIKTSSGIYDEHRFQVAAYWWLLREAGHEVKGVRIIRVGRTAGELFEEHVLSGVQVKRCWQVFQAALSIYTLRKQLR